MSLFAQPAFGSAALPSAAPVGAPHPPPPPILEVGGARLCEGAAGVAWAGGGGRPGGGEGRILWGPDSQRPQTHTCSGGGSPSSFVQTLVWTGVWLGSLAVLILAWVGAGASSRGPEDADREMAPGVSRVGRGSRLLEVVTGGPTPLQLPAV